MAMGSGTRAVSLATTTRRVVAGLLSASLVGLFVLPLVALFWFSGLGNLESAAGNGGFRTAIEFTLLASGLAVALGVLLGVPLGYVLARYRFPGRAAVESVVLLPILVPHLIVGLALLLLFDPTAPVGATFHALGIPVFDSIWGVVIVMLYVGASYTVLSSELAFRAVDTEAVEVARSLGASPTEAFATVTLPAAARGIVTGALLTWARGMSEVGAFLVFAYTVYPSPPYSGPVTNTASVYVYNLYQIGTLPGAAGAASLLVLVALAIFLAVRLLDRSSPIARWLGWGQGTT
jgi:ABC-type sulfate transport system permease component